MEAVRAHRTSGSSDIYRNLIVRYEDGHNPDLAIFEEVVAPDPPLRYIKGDVKERIDLTKYTHAELHSLIASKGFKMIPGHPYDGLSPEEIVTKWNEEQAQANAQAKQKKVPLHMQPGFQTNPTPRSMDDSEDPDDENSRISAPEDPIPALQAAAKEAAAKHMENGRDPADERMSKEAARRYAEYQAGQGHEEL